MGAPAGNQNAAQASRLLTSALKRILTQDPERVRKIAEKLIASAEAGEAWAMAMLHERVDGKVAQPVAVSGDPDAPPVQHSHSIEFVNGPSAAAK